MIIVTLQATEGAYAEVVAKCHNLRRGLKAAENATTSADIATAAAKAS
jgi:hypothetical protein